MREVALLQKYRHFHDELPLSVVDRLTELPREAQVEFYEEYTRRSRSEVAGYMLHLFFGLRYGYLDKWVLQVLAWLAWGFMGVGMVWWVVDFFRIPRLVKNHNRKVARNILKDVLLRYRPRRGGSAGRFRIGGQARSGERMTVHTPARPRSMPSIPDEIGGPGVGQLRKNYYLITNTNEKSWQIIYEGQYDWNDEQSEKEYKMIDETERAAFLFVQRDKGQWKTFLTHPVNMYSIHEHLEEEIKAQKRPMNILEWDGVTYYRENERDGYFFDLEREIPAAQQVRIWEYYDSSRKNYLRIKQLGNKEFRAFVGERLSAYDLTILPDAAV